MSDLIMQIPFDLDLAPEQVACNVTVRGCVYMQKVLAQDHPDHGMIPHIMLISGLLQATWKWCRNLPCNQGDMLPQTQASNTLYNTWHHEGQPCLQTRLKRITAAGDCDSKSHL